MSDENLTPQESEWLASPEDTVREALRDTVGDGEGLDERVLDALIARAKTVTAEQVEAAAWEYLHYTLTPNPSAARQSEWDRARRIVTTTFRAAGILIEGDDDE